MPPRINLLSALRRCNGTSPATPARAFSQTPITRASTIAQKRKRQDPYAQAQARARRAANLSRQAVLETERSKALGDPIRGLTTPFIESLDTAQPIAETSDPQSEQERYLNHFLTATELNNSLENSRNLTTPISTTNPGTTDPQQKREKERDHQREDSNAREAISRIVNLENGSGADRTRINVQRCIQTFGRHRTDAHLQPRPSSYVPSDPSAPRNEKTPRAGPDTGSSEVQIAILTAKIKEVADFLEMRGRTDKVNKKNLRLLVHRRQKLLKYLRRKERGGERFQNVVKTLGLTDGTWKGEISL